MCGRARRVLRWLFCVLLAAMVCATAAQAQGAGGSLTIEFKSWTQKEKPTGVVFSLYRVGSRDMDSATGWRMDESYAAAGYLDAATAEGQDAAIRQIVKTVSDNGTQPDYTAAMDDSAKAVLPSLPAGVYLGVCTSGPKELKVAPFIVSVPTFRDGKVIGNVEVEPKFEFASPTPTPPPDEHLPDTGDNLPVYPFVLGAIGIAALVGGLCLMRRE